MPEMHGCTAASDPETSVPRAVRTMHERTKRKGSQHGIVLYTYSTVVCVCVYECVYVCQCGCMHVWYRQYVQAPLWKQEPLPGL